MGEQIDKSRIWYNLKDNEDSLFNQSRTKKWGRKVTDLLQIKRDLKALQASAMIGPHLGPNSNESTQKVFFERTEKM